MILLLAVLFETQNDLLNKNPGSFGKPIKIARDNFHVLHFSMIPCAAY